MPGEIGMGPFGPFGRPQRLEPGDVAISIAALSEIALAPALELLNRAELERVERITCEDYRLHVVKARALLRRMLARFTGRSPESFEFDEGGGTQPRLRANPWGLHFSVSHSADWVAVAIAPEPIGIDIELVAPDCGWQDIAETCFHLSERRHLRDMSGPPAREAFFEIWTRKEAYLKAIGSALDTDPPSFSTVERNGAVRADAEPAERGTWYTRAISAPAHYKAALASRWPQPRLIHCQPACASAAHGESSHRGSLAVADTRSVSGFAG
jgi:4'-phosphopantetheinyl transferase